MIIISKAEWEYDLHKADDERFNYSKPLNKKAYEERVTTDIYMIGQYDPDEAERIAKARGLDLDEIAERNKR